MKNTEENAAVAIPESPEFVIAVAAAKKVQDLAWRSRHVVLLPAAEAVVILGDVVKSVSHCVDCSDNFLLV